MNEASSGVKARQSDAQRARIRLGVLLTTISAIVFSTAGLFVRSVAADSWSIIFWRGLFAATFTTIYVALRGSLRREFSRMGMSGVAVAALGASATSAFIPSFQLTTIANVSLIYATAPFVAAGLAYLWFRERPTRAVVASSVLALLGVAVIVGASFGGLRLRGDALALTMTTLFSAMMVVYRRYPGTPASGPVALSSLLLLLPAACLGAPFAVSTKDIGVLAAFGVVFAVASVTLSEGARRLPPGEAALLSALETPFAPLWAWLILAEAPAPPTIVGGGLILLAVLGSQLKALRRTG